MIKMLPSDLKIPVLLPEHLVLAGVKCKAR